MNDIDFMLARLLCMQDSVTHANEMGPKYAEGTRELIDARNKQIAAILMHVERLERTAKYAASVLNQAADNPSNDTENRSVYRSTADDILSVLYS